MRPQFLDGLTAEVAELVLRDNTAQNALLLTERRCPPASFPSYERLMQFLEGKGELDRRLEGLPDSQTLEERMARGKGLTSPELAVLAAYSKNILAGAIRSDTLLRDPYFESVLRGLFPGPGRGEVWCATQSASAAGRHHRHGCRQRNSQYRRHHSRFQAHGRNFQ